MKRTPYTILTLTEAADLLRLDPGHLSKLAQSGEVPAARIGKRWRFHRAAIEDIIRRAGP